MGRMATPSKCRARQDAGAPRSSGATLKTHLAKTVTSTMRITTSRFGQIDVDENRLISFPKGLLGFPGCNRYALLETNDEGTFWWLQSIDAPELAFVVTDPSFFVPTYRVPIKPDQLAELGVDTLEDAQVFVIVNKRDNLLTGNLQGPLVVNIHSRCGEQMVLSDRRFTTRVPLIEVATPAVHAASA